MDLHPGNILTVKKKTLKMVLDNVIPWQPRATNKRYSWVKLGVASAEVKKKDNDLPVYKPSLYLDIPKTVFLKSKGNFRRLDVPGETGCLDSQH